MTDTPNPKDDQKDQKSVNEDKNLGYETLWKLASPRSAEYD